MLWYLLLQDQLNAETWEVLQLRIEKMMHKEGFSSRTEKLLRRSRRHLARVGLSLTTEMFLERFLKLKLKESWQGKRITDFRMMHTLVVKMIASLYVEIKGTTEPAKTQESNRVKSLLNIVLWNRLLVVGWGTVTKQPWSFSRSIGIVPFQKGDLHRNGEAL